MSPRRLKIAIMVALTLLSGRSLADDLPPGHYVLKAPAVVDSSTGKFTLPVGTHVVDKDTWNLLDTEVKRLQDQETRLKAENKSLKDSLNEWSPGIGTMAVIAGSVVVVGLAVHYWPD